jgi:hypothetical protein
MRDLRTPRPRIRIRPRGGRARRRPWIIPTVGRRPRTWRRWGRVGSASTLGGGWLALRAAITTALRHPRHQLLEHPQLETEVAHDDPGAAIDEAPGTSLVAIADADKARCGQGHADLLSDFLGRQAVLSENPRPPAEIPG